MSESALLDVPDSPPPPAYELTEQEYDQKTSQVAEASRAEPIHRSDSDEFWEVWDEAAFEAAAAALTLSEGSSSGSSNATRPTMSESVRAKAKEAGVSSGSSDGVAPLRIVKRTARSPSSPKEKERPSWYDEAQLGRPQGTSSSQADINSSQSPPRRQLPPSPRRLSNDEREPTPPPSFEAVGPSLDGPPYEEANDHSGPTVIMTYNAGSYDSPPASPLQSPTLPPSHSHFGFPPPDVRSYTSPSQPARYQPSPSPQSVHSLATATVAAAPPPRVPALSSQSKFSVLGPRVPFNPQLAYNKRSRFGMPDVEEPLSPNVDASAFYASSVSSYIPSKTSSAPRRTLPRPASTMFASPVPQRASNAPTVAHQLSSAYVHNNHSSHSLNLTTSHHNAPYNCPSNAGHSNNTASHSMATPQDYPIYGQQPLHPQPAYPGYNQQSWPAPSGGQPNSQYGQHW